MFKQHELSVQKLGVMPNEPNSNPSQAFEYIMPISRATAQKNLNKMMLENMGDSKGAAINEFKNNKSVFCSCDHDERTRKFSRSVISRKSKICMTCGKILPAGMLLGKEKEMILAGDRLRVVDLGMQHPFLPSNTHVGLVVLT